MMIPNSFLLVCAVIGLLVALALWWFAIIPWWAILLVTIAAPVAVGAALLVLLYGAWIASGSH